MRIIHFVANLSNLRGLENQALLQHKNLNKRNIESHIWTLSQPVDYCQNLNNYLNCQLLFPNYLKPKIIFAFIFLFFKSLSIRRQTIFHIHGLSEYVMPLIFARIINNNISLIVKISNSGKKSTFIKIRRKFGVLSNILLTLSIANIDKWIAINSDIKDELANEGVNNNRIFHIPNGVDIKVANHVKKIANSIAWVGSLVPHKNLELLLKIIKQLPQDYTLTIYGTGPMFDSVSKDIHDHLLTDRVFMAGWVDQKELHSLLSSHSIYISTSIAEGMSNGLLESLAAGLIPICYNITANRDVLGEDYPLTISSLYPQKWVSKIITIKDNQDNLNKLLRLRVNQYEINYIIEKLISLYSS